MSLKDTKKMCGLTAEQVGEILQMDSRTIYDQIARPRKTDKTNESLKLQVQKCILLIQKELPDFSSLFPALENPAWDTKVERSGLFAVQLKNFAREIVAENPAIPAESLRVLRIIAG